MKLSLKIVIYTDSGHPCGSRIERGNPLPVDTFSFPCTKDGMAQATDAMGNLQKYIDTNIKKAKVKK